MGSGGLLEDGDVEIRNGQVLEPLLGHREAGAHVRAQHETHVDVERPGGLAAGVIAKEDQREDRGPPLAPPQSWVDGGQHAVPPRCDNRSMSRRFPGMNPFLQGQLGEDFHTEFITAIRANLAGTLMPGYVVKIENRVYIERAVDETVGVIRPDAYVAEGAPREVHVSRSARAPGQVGSALTPVVPTLPVPEHVEEPLHDPRPSIRRGDNGDRATFPRQQAAG